MEAVNIAQLKFKNSGIKMARLEAEMLAAHVLKCERHHLYLNRELMMDSEQINIYYKMAEERSLGKPIQYIIGYREFMGLNFKVDKNVLIPRCDTEILVESALGRLPSDREVLVADVGTGSGAIGVSIAHYMPKAKVFATDRDEGALGVARTNAKIHGVEDRVQFLKGDMFSAFGDQFIGMFDAVISNPPYIPTGEIDILSTDVSKYEPRAALDGGEDGLDFYKEISSKGHLFLKDDGFIALEVGYGQALPVSKILQNRGGYADICSIEDLSGIERVVIAYILNGKKE